jgi:hypothetical protein
MALGLGILLHHVLIAVFAGRGNQDATKPLAEAFSTWLPVLSGLAGSAVAYYFTRER